MKGAAKEKQLILVDDYTSAEFFSNFYYDQVYSFRLLISFFTPFHGYFSHAMPYDYAS
jgi:hypothetical protein